MPVTEEPKLFTEKVPKKQTKLPTKPRVNPESNPGTPTQLVETPNSEDPQLNCPSNCVKQLDFKHLQYLLAVFEPQEEQGDYHRLLKQINHNWASRLKFNVKITRPPKWARDNASCSLKLYCGEFKGKTHPDSCQFALSFKFEQGTWTCSDQYSEKGMTHSKHKIYTWKPVDEVKEEVIGRPSDTSERKEDSGLAMYGYLQQYRQLITQMQTMEKIVKKQGRTLNLSSRILKPRKVRRGRPSGSGQDGKNPKNIHEYS